MRIAVTGATGVVGQRVVRELASGGQHEVVALTRRREAVTANVASAYADYDDANSLRTALRGVDSLVFVSSDGEAARMMTHHENVVRAVEQNAVANVVSVASTPISTHRSATPTPTGGPNNGSRAVGARFPLSGRPFIASFSCTS